MLIKKTSTLSDILSQGTLQVLQERAATHSNLNTLLGLYLNDRLRNQVRVAAYSAGTLTLMAANTTVAGQLRYLSHIYMQQLRVHDEFCDLKRILVTISPENTNRSTLLPADPAPPRKISPQTAKLLENAAKALGEGEISEALRRLASHASDSD